MALADDIRGLRDRAVAGLNAAHDYYPDTKIAWRIVHKVIEAGHTVTIRNMVTGTVAAQADLSGKARGYVAGQLAEATFQQFVSVFEDFFFDLLRLWLLAYPQALGSKQVDFKVVLDAPDKQAVALYVVNRELNEIMYQRPADWFAYLEGRVKLGCPAAEEVARFTEVKASRDVLVHNRGIANKIYESKAGKLARYKDGERIDIPEPYHRQTWELIRKVVTDISNAAAAKAT
jgi:hypothetical protein